MGHPNDITILSRNGSIGGLVTYNKPYRLNEPFLIKNFMNLRKELLKVFVEKWLELG